MFIIELAYKVPLTEIDAQMFHVSAGKRLKPGAWPAVGTASERTAPKTAASGNRAGDDFTFPASRLARRCLTNP